MGNKTTKIKNELYTRNYHENGCKNDKILSDIKKLL